MSNYSEKFKDPRWQKKRLEILERDEFCCQICYDDKSTLHIHHKYYKTNKEPWEYPNTALVTLCVDCHESEQDIKKPNEILLINTLYDIGFLADDLMEIAFAFSKFNLYAINGVVTNAFVFFMQNPDNQRKMIKDHQAYIKKQHKKNAK